MNEFSKGAALFIGGAIVGAAVALLLAPKTGKEFREELKDLADKKWKEANEKPEEPKEEVSDVK